MYQEITIPNMPIDLDQPALTAQDVVMAWKELRDYRLALERAAKTIKSELESVLEEAILNRMKQDGVEGFRVPGGNCYMTRTAHLEVTDPVQFVTRMYECMAEIVAHGGAITDALWLQMRPAKQRLEDFAQARQAYHGENTPLTDESFNAVLGKYIGVERVTTESLGFRNK